MRKIGFLLLSLSLLTACKSSRTGSVDYSQPKTKYYTPPADERAAAVVNKALDFQGTRYKFGGTTSKGMDCSGLVYVAFGSENIELPRMSRQMAEEGKRIETKEVNIGDLLFFRTNRSKRINHVGLVVDIKPGEILFIHSSTSRGVIISSLDEEYWDKAYAEARRII